MKKEYAEYVEQQKMTTEAEMILERHLLRHKLLRAHNFQQRQYIEKRVKDLDNMIRLHRRKQERKQVLVAENSALSEKQQVLKNKR